MLDLLGDINYLAVAVAALAFFAWGSIWYAPPVMGRRWQAAAGISDASAGMPLPVVLIITYIAYFIQATVLAMLARGLGLETVGDGLELGSIIAVGILAMAIWVGTAYEQRSGALAWINIVNALIGFLIMAVIVTVWR